MGTSYFELELETTYLELELDTTYLELELVTTYFELELDTTYLELRVGDNSLRVRVGDVYGCGITCLVSALLLKALSVLRTYSCRPCCHLTRALWYKKRHPPGSRLP